MPSKKLNAKQIYVLRHAGPNGRLGCDRSTGKALAARGFALESERGFFITEMGMARRLKGADYPGQSGPGIHEKDDSLMRDWTPPTNPASAAASSTTNHQPPTTN